MAKNVVVVGTQWGDEGKGKIVDWLTDHAQGVVFRAVTMPATRSLSARKYTNSILFPQALFTLVSSAISVTASF
jgi:adenylosuccinate synthase